MASNEVIILSMSDTNYVGSLVIRRNDLDTPSKRFKCVKKDGTPFDFTDYTPVFEVRTPAGKIIRDYNSETHNAFTSEDVEDGSFTYTFSNALFNEVGDYQLAYFVFEKWDNARESMLNRKSTQNFSFKVVEDAYSGSPTPSDSLADWLQLLEQYQSWRKQLEDIIFYDKESLLDELNELKITADALQVKFDDINPAQLTPLNDFNDHKNNENIHVTKVDKDNWDDKETSDASQEKADKALSDAKTYVDSKTTQTLWTGGYHMTAAHTVTPSIPLNKCKAWVIYWSKYSGGVSQDYYWCTQLVTKEVLGGHNFDIMMDGSAVHKYIYISNTQITGSNDNSVGTNGQAVMRKVVAIL
ncbi:hypothetical protein AJN15_06485 [Listeria monocytogenes]|uniref:BppU family phage baseplate upper protein n=1 Tax=Listeria monocytogenes TaxID=1639 RepID=UPI00086CDC47|nr:BppU family phage baseplate upper protein [Listeria monocytogenes]EAG6798052.1 DUF2479 domain-containing protein [Listeria monocytogenes]OEQ27167.1 hypothetical protein AJN15_06485 [Listeria monocytogenes]